MPHLSITIGYLKTAATKFLKAEEYEITVDRGTPV
jgi:hypothetical protein